MEVLAAKEVRRYLGLLVAGDGAARLELHSSDVAVASTALSATEQGAVSVVTATRDHAIYATLRTWDPSFSAALDAAAYHRDSHLLHSLRAPRGGTVVVCAGATSRATLYAAYSLAEHLGARFHLHGDVLPSPVANLVLPHPGFSQPFTPRFSVRGLQPFHDFPMGVYILCETWMLLPKPLVELKHHATVSGPDFWQPEFWRALATNMAKLKFNFFGFHTYPIGYILAFDSGSPSCMDAIALALRFCLYPLYCSYRRIPEPLVWIGTPNGYNKTDGTIFDSAAYETSWYQTADFYASTLAHPSTTIRGNVYTPCHAWR